MSLFLPLQRQVPESADVPLSAASVIWSWAYLTVDPSIQALFVPQEMPASIHHLASEVVLKILGHIDTEDWLVLSTVSSDFYRFAVTMIYQDIDLWSASQITECCKTLVQNQQAAAAVRSISFQEYETYSSV